MKATLNGIEIPKYDRNTLKYPLDTLCLNK